MSLQGTDEDRRVSREFREVWAHRGSPTCATCGGPAVLRDGVWFHATDRHPEGLPKEMDRREHQVTTETETSS